MTILSLALAVLLFLQISQVEGDYVVSLLTRSFSNPDNMCRFCDGDMPSCCDAMNETTGLCAVCDSIAFQYCLRFFTGSTDCMPTQFSTPSNGQVVDFTSNTVLGLPNPLLLPMATGKSGLWIGTRLQIGVFEYDDGLFDGLIDRFFIDIAASTMPGSSVSDLYVGMHNIATIELTYQVVCNEGFIGNTCSQDLCFNVNCNQGRCDQGNCVCNGGFIGERCNVVDPCFNVNCNQGRCDRGNCVCNGGFIGERCDMVDPCFSVNCNRGRCVDGDCVCNEGVIGERCDMVDPCSVISCGNGKCDREMSAAVCRCDPGYIGTTCDVDICSLSDCEPTGKCIVQGSDYTCHCEPGFIGERCEIRDFCAAIDCGSVNCSNLQQANCSRGTCVNQAESFECDCDPGFTGTFCEVAVTCENSSCNGRGQCHNLVESYMCVCDSGYTGSNCNDLIVRPLMTIWVAISVGGFVGVVSVLVLVTIVMVALIRRHHKEPNSTANSAGEVVVWNRGRDSNPIPGDNPVYMLAPGESRANTAIYDIVGQPLKEEDEERLFKNPMYGDPDPQQYEVPVLRATTSTPAKEEERIFENPMYSQPDPAAYEVPSAINHTTNFLLDPMTTPTSATPTTKQRRGPSVSNVYEEPVRPAQTNTTTYNH